MICFTLLLHSCFEWEIWRLLNWGNWNKTLLLFFALVIYVIKPITTGKSCVMSFGTHTVEYFWKPDRIPLNGNHTVPLKIFIMPYKERQNRILRCKIKETSAPLLFLTWSSQTWKYFTGAKKKKSGGKKRVENELKSREDERKQVKFVVVVVVHCSYE